MMRVGCISDTHNKLDQIKIPDEVDLLVHAGDSTMMGTEKEIIRFNGELTKILPGRYKVIVAGNHDWLFQTDEEKARALLSPEVHYLKDQECEIGIPRVGKVRLYGSPWQPEFGGWAFNLPRGHKLRAKWEKIPEGLDFLITHGPPRNHGDFVPGAGNQGDHDLLHAVLKKKPRYHIFGHIHEGYGITHGMDTTFVNAACCTAAYKPTNKPIIVEI